MIIEALIEQSIVDALQSELGDDVQLVGSRIGTKIEDADKKTIVAVASGFRNHDAFSLSLVNVPVAISVATRVEGDAQSQEHNEVVEKIVDILVDWHKYGEAMSDALTNKKFLAGELRMDGGTTQTFDRERMIWTDTININIRGSERFVPPVTKNRIWWTDMTYTDFDGNVFSSAEQVDVVLYDIGRTRDQILECDVCQSGMADAAFAAMPNLETVWLAPVVQSMVGDLFYLDPKLKEVYFAEKSEDEVRAMQDYPWGIQDTSIIKTQYPFTPHENCAWFTDGTALKGIENMWSSAEQLDNVCFDANKDPYAIEEAYVFQDFVGYEVFFSKGSLRKVYFDDSVQTINGNIFNPQSTPLLDEVYFAGRTMEQVQDMNGYPWGLTDTSIIHSEL